MRTDHVLGATVGLGALPPMARASLTRRRFRHIGYLRIRHALRRALSIPPGHDRRDAAPGGREVLRVGLRAKEQDPEPLQAERRLLQGKQQPKIPLEHQVQHAPIGRGQGIPGEPRWRNASPSSR